MDWAEALAYLLNNPNGAVKNQYNDVIGRKDDRLVELTSLCYRIPEIYKEDRFIIVE